MTPLHAIAHRPVLRNGRAVMSSEESCGSSSDDDSDLWTEEFDEEFESIYFLNGL